MQLCGTLVLIETYWNVNFKVIITKEEENEVLIETYWNVNSLSFLVSYRPVSVLIETYWNVNSSACGLPLIFTKS